MRISSQNNQFLFNLPIDFIDVRLEEKFLLLFEKNWIPYDSVISYINSSIKEIVFPSIQFETSEQVIKRGKNISWKDANNVFDTYTRELDITFRSMDSHLNFFMIQEVLINFFLNNDQPYIPYLHLSILDKDGDIIYNINFKEILLKSISENRLSYNVTDVSEKTFSITFTYNFIDVIWMVDDKKPIEEKSIFDIPLKDVNDRSIGNSRK